MKVYQFQSDGNESHTQACVGRYTNGIIYVPGPYQFYDSIEELLIEHNKNQKYLEYVEEYQLTENFQLELIFMKRPMVYWGEGNHKLVEVFDTNAN